MMECPKCHRQNPFDSKFCNQCGYRFTEDAVGIESTPPVASERKYVTIMFSDMSGYAYSLATIITRVLKTELFLKVGPAREALSEAEKGIRLSKENRTEMHELIFLGYKAEAQQRLGDAEGARASIAQALELHEKQSVKIPGVWSFLLRLKPLTTSMGQNI
jgi:hypothetical protein